MQLEYVRLQQLYQTGVVVLESPKRCKTGECGGKNRSVSFKGSLNKTLWNVLPLLNASHAFVNLGWEFEFGFQHQSKLYCELSFFEKLNSNVKLYLLSHHPNIWNERFCWVRFVWI